MSKKFIVGLDDSAQESRALKFALELLQENTSTSIHIIHVLEWSPYSFLSTQELEERHTRRKQELTRANDILISPVLEELNKNNISASGEVRYGSTAETISKYCEDLDGDMIFINRSNESKVSARFFGSVPSTLVQVSKVPVIVVP